MPSPRVLSRIRLFLSIHSTSLSASGDIGDRGSYKGWWILKSLAIRVEEVKLG